ANHGEYSHRRWDRRHFDLVEFAAVGRFSAGLFDGPHRYAARLVRHTAPQIPYPGKCVVFYRWTITDRTLLRRKHADLARGLRGTIDHHRVFHGVGNFHRFASSRSRHGSSATNWRTWSRWRADRLDGTGTDRCPVQRLPTRYAIGAWVATVVDLCDLVGHRRAILLPRTNRHCPRSPCR